MIKKFGAVLLAAVLVVGAAGCSQNVPQNMQSSRSTDATAALDTVDFVAAVTDKDLRDKNVDYLVQRGYKKNTDNDILSYCKQGEYLGYTLNYQYTIDDDSQKVSYLYIIFENYADDDIDSVKIKYTQFLDALNKIGQFATGTAIKNFDREHATDITSPYDVLLLLDDDEISHLYTAWQIGGNYLTVDIIVDPNPPHAPYMSLSVDQGSPLIP